ncbi:hypothetical protein ACJJTC_005942 [Scirpophaga incertulas]
MDELIHLNSKCRLCFENPGLRDIFENEDLLKEIFLCTGLKLHPDGRLPQKICERCFEIVKKAKELRSKAKDNDFHLQSIFNAITEWANESCGVTNSSKNICVDSTEIQDVPVKSRISVRNDLCSVSPESATSKRKSKESDEIILDTINTCKKLFLEDKTVLYECRVCQKRYDKWKKLYLHQRSHKKSIACPIAACGKKFVTKGDVEKHLRTHTGVKPFACDECDRSFTQRCSLKQHKETINISPRQTRRSVERVQQQKKRANADHYTDDERVPAFPGIDAVHQAI